MPPVLNPWSDDQVRAFGHRPLSFGHRLSDGGLVDDDALVELLDRYPRDAFDINVYDFDDDAQVSLRTGERGSASGEAVLAAIKAGRVWVNLHRADLHYPAMGEAIRAAFREMAERVPGFRPVNVYGQLIISSPTTKVPYHADPAGVVLFHLRGRKRIWIYPPDEAHAPQRNMELICMKQVTEELPYARDYDTRAQAFDLEPGQAVAWPLHAPHRIDNQGVLNVSFSADYQTWASRRLNGAMVASGVMRRAGLPTPALARTGALSQTGLWAASVAMKKAGLVKSRLASFERSFELGGDQPVAKAA